MPLDASTFRSNFGDHRFNSPLINLLDPSGANGESHLSTQAGNPVGLSLDIDIESPLGLSVGMGDLMSKTGLGTGDLANA